MNLMQFGGGDWISSIIWFILLFVFILFYPRLMIYQVVAKIQKDLDDIFLMADKGRDRIMKKITKKPSKELKEKISNFMEFFIATPVTLDPYGIVNKIHMVIKHAEDRELEFVREIAPNLSDEEVKDVSTALIHNAGIYQIAKIIRHYLELIKRYRLLQIAMLIQMQIPLIKKVADALLKSVEAFVDNAPVGDGIGPLVIASMIPEKAKVVKLKDEQFAYAKVKIEGKDVILAKALGPGTTIGYPGKFVEKISKREKIDRIITVDAAGALYGEKDGVVMDGVGVGQRGNEILSYHSFQIEEVALKKGIPIDSIGIKEVGENAIYPMKEEIYKSLKTTVERIKELIRKGKKNEKILVIGFGNTSGVGNNRSSLKLAEEKIKKNIMKMKKEERERKKKQQSFWYKLGIFGASSQFLLR
ncbi:MAG: DUF1512 family protein [Candidatus Aenigmarchaeota archaeon]|nr:DUF1512 family protein [Candidatus Aenigmarchaeota archaeon]